MILIADLTTCGRVLSMTNGESTKRCVDFYDAARLEGVWPEIVRRLAGGEDLLYIGLDGLDQLRELWLDAEPPVRVAGVRMGELRLRGGKAARWAFRPPQRYALHGVHEEPRAVVESMAETLDAFGQDAGACGLRCRHVRRSMCDGRYEGALWIALAMEPAMLSDAALKQALHEMRRAEMGLYLSELQTEYAWYRAGERVNVRVSVQNRSDRLQAAEICLKLCRHGAAEPEDRAQLPLMISGRDGQTVSFDFYPQQGGNWYVKAELMAKDRMVYGHAREKHGEIADVRQSMFRVASRADMPEACVKNGRLCVGGFDGFLMGTHLYPSTTFFEASYRPLRLDAVAREIEVMRRSGLRLCRIWCDPLLDETSARGMRALAELLGERGMTAIITLFSSWTREMRVQTSRRRAHFYTADMENDALIGLYLKDMEAQCLYAEEIAERFADLPNIVWDLSNEFTVVDPDQGQLGGWEDEAEQTGVRRSIQLFRQWSGRLCAAMRAAGARQPMHFGVNCWDTGADNDLCNKEADLVATHLYCAPERIRYLAAMTNPRSSGKPFLLEEFGGPWSEDSVRAREYERRYFEFLAAGFQGVLNYEWGVAWLSDELPGTAPYMKYNSDMADDELKGFHYEGRRAYARTWPHGSTGLCPWIASTEYGVNRSCLPGETRTTRVMKQFARLAEALPRMHDRPSLLVVVPFEVAPYRQGVGYARVHESLDALLDMLWSAGEEFMLWQENDLDKVPGHVKTVLMPNEQRLSEATMRRLDALKVRGICVRTAGQMPERFPGREDISFNKDAADVRIHARSDGEKRQFLLFARNPISVRIGRYELDVEESATLCIDGGRLTCAAVKGRLCCDGRQIFCSEMRVGVLAEDGGMTLLPFGEGALETDAGQITAEDDSGVVAMLPVIQGKLRIGTDECGYRYRLPAQDRL